jgi:hypothetical protein
MGASGSATSDMSGTPSTPAATTTTK